MNENIPCNQHMGWDCFVLDFRELTGDQSKTASTFISDFLSPRRTEISAEKSGFKTHLMFNDPNTRGGEEGQTETEIYRTDNDNGDFDNVTFADYKGDILFVTKCQPSQPNWDKSQMKWQCKLGVGNLYLQEINREWASMSQGISGYMTGKICSTGDGELDRAFEGTLSFQHTRNGASGLVIDGGNTTGKRTIHKLQVGNLVFWASRAPECEEGESEGETDQGKSRE